MSVKAILLETGGLDYLLDESNDPILLEELDENIGYLNQYFSIPNITLEDGEFLKTEELDQNSFLFLEHEYTNFLSTFSLSLSCNGSQDQYWGSGTIGLGDLTCGGLAQSSESTFGYLDPGVAIGLGNLTVDATLTNVGTHTKFLSNLQGLSILGILYQNFGFLNSSGEYNSLTLGGISASSSGAIITPNYGYFVNYIY